MERKRSTFNRVADCWVYIYQGQWNGKETQPAEWQTEVCTFSRVKGTEKKHHQQSGRLRGAHFPGSTVIFVRMVAVLVGHGFGARSGLNVGLHQDAGPHDIGTLGHRSKFGRW
ncbi:uncharacterized protein LOC143914573 [Arctopsyche grandis]|uniref:uncharacterized protein LOC143914573 n=1 Tax=Arctopsyche grandis TaxID=121162 RepID=UPI00406D8430